MLSKSRFAGAAALLLAPIVVIAATLVRPTLSDDAANQVAALTALVAVQDPASKPSDLELAKRTIIRLVRPMDLEKKEISASGMAGSVTRRGKPEQAWGWRA